ncbi:hypothetical protein DFH09DRAFT_1424506 [Mycena vulgaris]|nr:hypothetical protein DFH09DRAFT_1424506 [Mycena vulgaris]
MHTVVLVLSVYLLESSILFFCIVYLMRPNWIPLHKLFHSPVMYHRTHISHKQAEYLACACPVQTDSDLGALCAGHGLDTDTDTDTDTTPADFDSDGMPGLEEVSCDEEDYSDSEDEQNVDYSENEHSVGNSTANSVPELEDIPTGNSPFLSPFQSSANIFVTDPPHPRRCLHYLGDGKHDANIGTYKTSGGGTGKPVSSSSPIDIPTTEDDDISDGASAYYSSSDWIAAGRTWSSSLTRSVKRARDAARHVPFDAPSTIIPDKDMLFEALPTPSIDTRPALFSTEPENIENTSVHWPHTLFTAISFLPALRASFNDAWLSGSKSICFHHLPGKFYSLWVENLRSEIQSFVNTRSRWQMKHTHPSWIDPGVSSDVYPGTGLCPGSAVRSVLLHQTSSFLGTDWLNDEMINAGTDWILRRLEPWSRIRILNCLFIQSLGIAHTAAAGGSYAPPQFSPIEQAVRAGKVSTLYFPLHVSGNHWTLLKIDLLLKTIAYADSLGGSPPADYDAWSPDHAECHHVQWFLDLSETLAAPGEIGSDASSDFELLETATTPEPSDFEDGAMVASELADADMPSHAASPFQSSLPSPIRCDSPIRFPDEVLQLDDVNFFLDLLPSKPSSEPDSLPVSTPEYFDYINELPIPKLVDDASLSDDWVSVSSRARRSVRTANGPKAGSSWARHQELKTRAKDPDFRPNTTRLGTFRDHILHDDPLAEFDNSDVRCHRETAKCKKCTGTSTQSLFSLGFKKLSACSSITTVPTPPRRTIPLPCPGLIRESDEEIATYIARTSVAGGGAPSRPRLNLAMGLFSMKYSGLDSSQQRMVLGREITLQRWNIGRAVGAVFSASCLRDVTTLDGDEPEPCTECWGLYKLHGFKVAIHRPMSEENSMKYVPVAYRDKELGTLYLRYHGVRDLIELDDGRSPWLKFAQGCADGTYSSDTLTGMVKAMVLKSTRVKQGRCMKNFKYSPEFDQFCNLLASASPRAYVRFQKIFGGPGLRAMRAKRAKMPRFQPDLSASNVAAAADILKKLKYDGPVALSWDDTALEACISVYQESKEVCLILGGVDASGAIRGTKGDDLDALFEAATLKKADKLRVWMLSIPLPKISPILIAAVARGSSTKANYLHNIHPISLASDGADVERAAQRSIADSAPEHLVYVIPNPTPGCETILKIPLYYGHHPTIILQDSKHTLKTAPANIAGPLYVRGVERVDKQDDRAAARLFSGNTLEFQLQNYPGQTGISVYLFIFGELVDAWQNRNISHRDRAKIILRARFFLMAWRSHTDSHPDHHFKTQFISRESYDIFLTVCDGLLSLMVSYHKYFPMYPLLPWLHSTEVCEHLFGMLRQLKKNFNYADVLYLERKLRVLMMGAFGNLSPDEQANQTAGGYHHTYFSADDLDVVVLTQYPTDEELVNASKYAFDEASQLLKILGIAAEPMLKNYRAPEPVVFQPVPASARPKLCPPRTILELLTLYQSAPSKSSKDEGTFEACELALIAEDLEKSLNTAALPDSTEESLEDLSLDIKLTLEILSKVRPGSTPASPADYTLPLTQGNSLNDLILVSERMRHQLKSTAKAVRKHRPVSVSMMRRNAAIDPIHNGSSLCESLMARIAGAVSLNTQNKTTWVDRYVRHAGTYGGSAVPANKRVQNKATVKSVAASKFGAARAKAFGDVQWIHENMHLANITDYNPLKPDDFVFFLKPGTAPEVLLGTVTTMVTKNTHHDLIPSATSVGTPSYIYVAVYRRFLGGIFSSIACETLSCPMTLQIPRTHILFSLASFKITRQVLPTAEGYPHTLATLCPSSPELLQKLRQSQTALSAAVKQLAQLIKDKIKLDNLPLSGEMDVGVEDAAVDEAEDDREAEVAE